jgi:hypothetical protein
VRRDGTDGVGLRLEGGRKARHAAVGDEFLPKHHRRFIGCEKDGDKPPRPRPGLKSGPRRNDRAFELDLVVALRPRTGSISALHHYRRGDASLSTSTNARSPAGT